MNDGVQDTYFFDSKTALRIANEKNRVFSKNKIVSGLQICYYDGHKLDDAPDNCINVPLEDIVYYFSNTKNRLPTFLNTFNSSGNMNENSNIYYENIKKANYQIKNKIDNIQKQIKASKLNFSDQKLRVFAHACRETVLIKYIIENILSIFKECNCEIYIHKQNNEMESCSELFYLEAMKRFNPHIIININHLNNTVLNKDVFNFIWFQDQMPVLTNEDKIMLRDRDFIFSLLDIFDELLMNKGVKQNKIMRQSICTNLNIYNTNYKALRENKIVFIGNSFSSHFKNYDNEEEARLEIIRSLETAKIDLDALSLKYGLDRLYIINYLYPAVIRQELVKYICKNSKIKVEIYGKGWESIDEIKSNYKGILGYGQDVAKVYNTAKYGLVLNGYYQQRLFEMASCGTIPVVYVYPTNMTSSKYEKSCLMFNNIYEYENCFCRLPENSLENIVNDASYAEMVDNILDIVQSNVHFEKKVQCTFCTEPWSNLMLRWGGRVQPCCMNSTSLGDINTDSFEDIWNGEKIQNIRKLIKEGKYNEAGCNSDCHIIYELSKTKNRSFISEELYEASTKSESFFNNVNKFQQDVLNGNVVVSSSPLTYDIQPTEFCNMACIMCHQNHHNKATIPVDVIDKLFVKKENIYFVRFQGGEVFVDKEFTNYLLKLKKDFSSYQKINVITNGSLVSSDDLDALTSGENTISFIISMDSLNENVYKYIRQNPHFEKVKSTLIHLSNIQKRKNNFDIVVWNFMIMKSNFYEIKLAIEFALKYNIKVYFYPILGNYESENIFKYLNLRPDNCIQYIKEAIDMIELSNTGIISGLDKTLEILSSEVENG